MAVIHRFYCILKICILACNGNSSYNDCLWCVDVNESFKLSPYDLGVKGQIYLKSVLWLIMQAHFLLRVFILDKMIAFAA